MYGMQPTVQQEPQQQPGHWDQLTNPVPVIVLLKRIRVHGTLVAHRAHAIAITAAQGAHPAENTQAKAATH